MYYIHQVDGVIASLPVDTGFHQKPFRILPVKTSLMAGPSEKMPVKTLLQKDTYVTVIGQSGDWYRITLPDNSEGYLRKKQLAPLNGGVKTKLDSTQVLLSAVHTDAVPIAFLEKDTAVEILAHFEDYNFIITENGHAGWLYN